MKSLSTLVLAMAGVAMAHPVLADVVGGEVGLSYGVVDADSLDGNLTGVTLHGSIDYAFTPSFGVQAGAAFDRYEFDEGSADVSVELRSFDLHGYYRLGAARVGAFVGREDLGEISVGGLGSMDADIQLTTYGLEADYRTGALTIGGHIGLAEIEDLDDVDTRFLGVDAAYALNERFAVLGDIDWTEVDAGGDSLTLTSVRVGGEITSSPALR